MRAKRTLLIGWSMCSICMNMKCGKKKQKKKNSFLPDWVTFVCLTAAEYSTVMRSCTIQRSIHFLYIHQSTHHLYLFILCGPRQLERLRSSKWEKGKVSFLYIFLQESYSRRSPRRVCDRHNIREPPYADVSWAGGWEMVHFFCLQKFKNVWLIRSICC